MSLDAVNAFRARLKGDASLHKPFAEALGRGPGALSELAQSQGFDVSPEEAAAAMSSGSGGEMSDNELELVSGGKGSGGLGGPGVSGRAALLGGNHGNAGAP